ncbi:MAG: tungstate transporter permease, partial [Chloroflexi bacterium]|nr:tungstate transporter permease [Chloroflexota bacterium]
MVGGNIRGSTQTLTSALLLEVQQGDFDTAIALSLILLAIIFVVVGTLTVLQQRRPAS